MLSIISFIDSFQFPSSSLDSLVKNLNQEFDFKYLSREYDNNVLDLVHQKILAAEENGAKIKNIVQINEQRYI